MPARKTTAAATDSTASAPTSATKKRASKKAPATKKTATKRASATMHKIGRSIGGNDLRFYTLAILTLLGMWKGTPVPRRMFVGFYMSKSILANHGGNGNLAVTADTVALTAQGRDFFNARIDAGLATKKDIASLAAALKTGDKKKIPERFASYASALYPHPASGAE